MADLTPTPVFNYLLKPCFLFFFSQNIPATLQNPQSGYGHVLPAEEMETSNPEARGLLPTLNLGLQLQNLFVAPNSTMYLEYLLHFGVPQ